jgi:hypothetical protein
MRKFYGMLWLLLGMVTTGQAQRVVRGTVQDASTKGVLPGVTILLKGTKVGVSNNIKGDFQLAFLRDTITLIFSSVGFKTLEKRIIVNQDTTTLLPVRLKDDCILDYFEQKHVELSLLSGLRYTPLGGKIKAL